MTVQSPSQITIRGLKQLRDRARPKGGFAQKTGGPVQPDATAWAVIALAASGASSDELTGARSALEKFQLADGRVSLLPDQPQAFWPTSPAILAWRGSPQHKRALEKAADFLLKTKGMRLPGRLSAIFGHDVTLQAWPWIEGNHSWLEPTGLAVMALEAAGRGDNPRVAVGRRLIMDRQIAGGGWNYGNTTVFGRELRPMPKTTGLALTCLAGQVDRGKVEKSLSYAGAEAKRTRTPLSLGWLILGLSAWGSRPQGAYKWIDETLKRQKTLGTFDTVPLSVLITAGFCRGRLVSPGK